MLVIANHDVEVADQLILLLHTWAIPQTHEFQGFIYQAVFNCSTMQGLC